MANRVVLGEEFNRAVKVRGLLVVELAAKARVSVPTISAALRHKPLNPTSALRICRALAVIPVVPELDAWVEQNRAA